MVIGAVAGTPGAIFLLHTEADAPIIPHYVVTGSLSAGRLEDPTSTLGRNLSHKAVNGYGVNDVVAWRGSVGREESVSC